MMQSFKKVKQNILGREDTLSKSVKNGNPKDYFGKIQEIQEWLWKGNLLNWRSEDLWRKPIHNADDIVLTVNADRADKKSSEYWSKEAIEYDHESFLSFFNKTKEDNFEEGKKDFADYIMDIESYAQSNISVKDYLGDTSEKSCLEIGFGGGRLLNSACEKFKNCVGVDIHQYFDRVDKILKDQGKSNFQLIESEEIKNVENESIDLAFSFIVFQHVDNLEIVRRYLLETNRLLKKSGLCVFYFGMNNVMPSIGALRIKGHEPGGYSLLFNPHRIEIEFMNAGLNLMSINVSPNWRQIVVIAKPGIT